MMPPKYEFRQAGSFEPETLFLKLFLVTPGVNENRYLPSPQTSSCQEPTIRPTPPPPARPRPARTPTPDRLAPAEYHLVCTALDSAPAWPA